MMLSCRASRNCPTSLKELAFRNGTELTHARWDSDVKLLVEDLRPYLEKPATAAVAMQPTLDQSSAATVRSTPPDDDRRLLRRSLWAVGGAAVMAGGVSIFGFHLLQDRPTVQSHTLAAAQTPPATETPRRSDNITAPALVAAKPSVKPADEPDKLGSSGSSGRGGKGRRCESRRCERRRTKAASAARAASARAAAARREAEEKRRREELERSAQRAEEQRKRDEEDRRIAQEQAERKRLAAEQAAAARMFAEIAAAVIGSRR